MTTLLIQELKSELIHEFTLDLDSRNHIAAFIPYFVINNTPTGTLKFEIIKDSEAIYSSMFNTESLKSLLGTSDNYFHAFFPFIPGEPMQMGRGSYTAKLSNYAGYSYSNDSFIGWVQQHEDIQNEMGYTPLNDTENPLAMRIKTYKQGIL